ncbi:MAG: YdcH family protein [Alphaproteobacteria bacterium]
MQEHLLSLKGKHASLDKELIDELQRPHPDQTLCAKLKRQKLRIKDEILRLEESAGRYQRSGAVH